MKYQKHRDLSHLSGFTWFIRHVLGYIPPKVLASEHALCSPLPSCPAGRVTPDDTQSTISHVLFCWYWCQAVKYKYLTKLVLIGFNLSFHSWYMCMFYSENANENEILGSTHYFFFQISDCLLEIQRTYIGSCPFILLGIMYIKPQQITKGSYGCWEHQGLRFQSCGTHAGQIDISSNYINPCFLREPKGFH